MMGYGWMGVMYRMKHVFDAAVLRGVFRLLSHGVTGDKCGDKMCRTFCLKGKEEKMAF